MKLPPPPSVSPVPCITPSFYNAALRCGAQAAWSRFGDRRALPGASSSLLGSAFHAVAEAAARGWLPDDETECRAAAYDLFDREAARLLAEAHPHVRSRYAAPAEMPYYYLSQARAAEAAVAMPASVFGYAGAPVRLAEKRLESRDGRLVGRVDLADAVQKTVFDYKSGAEPAEGVTEGEARQLRLYAYLCSENGIEVERGVIVRSSGRRDALSIAPAEADAEADAARAVLDAFNRAAGAGFESLATPSPQVCGRCPCLPICERFWAEAEPDWAEEAGCHVEGVIENADRKTIGGTDLIALRVRAQRGTAPLCTSSTDPLPAWAAEADGSGPLEAGQKVRIVGGGGAPGSPRIRMHRNGATAVWRVMT